MIKNLKTFEEVNYIISEDNCLYGAGLSHHGQLGSYNEEETLNFIKVLDNVKKVDRIAYFEKPDKNGAEFFRVLTFVLKNDNTLWLSGHTTDYSFCKIADNVKDFYCKEEECFLLKENNVLQKSFNIKEKENFFIDLFNNVKKIKIDKDNIFIITHDDTLYANGFNLFNKLGSNQKDKDFFKEFIKIDTNVKDVYSNWHATFIIKNNNSLWACGKNISYCFGIGNKKELKKFSKIFENVKEIHLGNNNLFIVTNNNLLFGAGQNQFFLLDNSPTKNFSNFIMLASDVKKFVFDDTKFFVLDQNDNLYGQGKNTYEMLGYNKGEIISNIQLIKDQVKDFFIFGSTTLVLCKDGTLYGCGLFTNVENKKEEKIVGNLEKMLDNIKNIVVDEKACFIVSEDNKVWCLGSNLFGELGLGNKETSSFWQRNYSIENIKTKNKGITVLNYIKGEKHAVL